MEAKTVSTRMSSLVVLFDLHTSLFPKAVAGISDDDAHIRLNTKANHIAWITGSLVQERFQLAQEFGIDKKQSADELFANHKGIQDGARYPALAVLQKDWEIITPLLRDALAKVTDERLDQPFEMPGQQMSFYDLVVFMTYREANCIGQLALWRRLLGYDAIKYD